MKTKNSSIVQKGLNTRSKKNITIESVIYDFECEHNLKLVMISSKRYMTETGRTFEITKSKGIIELDKQFEKRNDDIHYRCINQNDKKHYNKYLNIFNNKYYYACEIINDFGETMLEFKDIDIKIAKDKLRSFFNDCLHYMNKIVTLYESGEKSVDVLCGEIDGKHNDLYVIANVKEYNLLPNFKGGDCVEHIIGRMNTLLYIIDAIANKYILNIDEFRYQVFAKSKFIKTPSKFNTEIAKSQNNKLFESEVYIDLLKK